MQHNTQRDSRSLPPLTEENEPILAVVIAMLKSRAQSMHLDDTEARMYSNVMEDVTGEMERRGGIVLDAPVTTGVDREATAAMDTKSQAAGSGGNLRMEAKEFVHVFLLCLQQMEPAGRGIATTRMFHILDAVENTLGFFGYEGDIQSMGRVHPRDRRHLRQVPEPRRPGGRHRGRADVRASQGARLGADRARAVPRHRRQRDIADELNGSRSTETQGRTFSEACDGLRSLFPVRGSRGALAAEWTGDTERRGV